MHGPQDGSPAWTSFSSVACPAGPTARLLGRCALLCRAPGGIGAPSVLRRRPACRHQLCCCRRSAPSPPRSAKALQKVKWKERETTERVALHSLVPEASATWVDVPSTVPSQLQAVATAGAAQPAKATGASRFRKEYDNAGSYRCSLRIGALTARHAGACLTCRWDSLLRKCAKAEQAASNQ